MMKLNVLDAINLNDIITFKLFFSYIIFKIIYILYQSYLIICQNNKMLYIKKMK